MAFRAWAGDRHVTFPVSDRSKKSYSVLFPDDQKQEVTVYSTHVAAQEISPCDVYVFTSPSNVEGFLMTNELPESAKTIAWGATTAAALHEAGIRVDGQLEEPTIAAISQFV